MEMRALRGTQYLRIWGATRLVTRACPCAFCRSLPQDLLCLSVSFLLFEMLTCLTEVRA